MTGGAGIGGAPKSSPSPATGAGWGGGGHTKSRGGGHAKSRIHAVWLGAVVPRWRAFGRWATPPPVGFLGRAPRGHFSAV